MAIDSTKILTISLSDWIKVKGMVSLIGYDVKGIHANGKLGSILDKFSEKVPKDAEVVVDYRCSLAGLTTMSEAYASGTAIIPRRK